MQKRIARMSCAEIEAFVGQGGDANTIQGNCRHPDPTSHSRGIRYQSSLLERAVELRCLKTVRLLLKKGATLEHKKPKDFYVDETVSAIGRGHSLDVLGRSVEEELDGNCLLFLWSLYFKNVEVCQILYDAFVANQKPTVRYRTTLTAMAMVAEIDDIEFFRFMLAHGGEYLINAEQGSTTIFNRFCLHGNLEMVKILLERGANPNIGSHKTGYPLTEAISAGHEEVALLLIEHGVKFHNFDSCKLLSMARRHKLTRVEAAIDNILMTYL